MPYRTTAFVNQNFYHVYNRGVEKRVVFSRDSDYQRLLQLMHYYQFDGPKPRFSTYKRFKRQSFDTNPKIIEIIAYCLMPNHFHLILRQLRDGGIQEFIKKIVDSYTKYFNIKYKRVGPLFQGAFKAVAIESDEQLLHLSRYIHLNPYTSGLTKNLNNFPYSSYLEYTNLFSGISNKEPILDFFPESNTYAQFLDNQKEYSLTLEVINHLLIEDLDHTSDV